MEFFARIGQSIVLPMIALWESFLEALPYFLGGLLIIVFGYLLGCVLENLLERFLKRIHFDHFLHKLNLSRRLQHFDFPHLLGVLLKWYVVVIFLVPAASLARLGTLSILLIDFARWVPDLILGILIVLFAWLGTDIILHKIETTKVPYRLMVGHIVQIVLMSFAIVIALDQIGVNVGLVHQVFIILLAAVAFGIALAIGIGFGLGMKDEAKTVMRTFRKRMK